MENSQKDRFNRDLDDKLKNVLRPCNSKTVQFDNSMSASDIQALIDSQHKYIPYGQTLTFQFSDGSYTLTDSLFFGGFYGAGILYIRGNTSDTTLSTAKSVFLDFSSGNCIGIWVFGVTCYWEVDYLKIKIDTSTSSNKMGIYAQVCGVYGIINSNYVLGNGTSLSCHGIRVHYGSDARLANNYVSNIYYGITASELGKIYSSVNDDTGTQPKYGLLASKARIFKNGTQPAGSVANESTNQGGQID